MHFISKSVSLATLLLVSVGASAGNDPVNCRMVVDHQQNIYEGNASCTGTFWYSSYVNGSPKLMQGSKTLQNYIPATIHSSTVLSGLASIQVTGATGHTLTETHIASCSARIPFSHKQDVMKQECDYTPTASLSVYRYEASTTSSVSVNGSDSDGSIAKKELWVNGVKQSGTSTQLNGSVGDVFSVKGRVTDNDGYTNEYTKSVTLIYRPVQMCGRYPC